MSKNVRLIKNIIFLCSNHVITKIPFRSIPPVGASNWCSAVTGYPVIVQMYSVMQARAAAKPSLSKALSLVQPFLSHDSYIKELP